ncbi:hypothetical protein ACFVYD_31970 [Streptomyces sp. NPDC058301]|uniref:hypothetical protein n=1 Tax=Streptomyces sp. NPDC058301 TaxID=3346436 RepID=UPI0036E252CB
MDEALAEEELGLLAACAGRACLHLRVDPILLGWLMAVMPPALIGPGADAELAGLAGLRVLACTDVIELRMIDGHGRLVLPTDSEGHRTVREWGRDQDYTLCERGCPPLPCLSGADSTGHRDLMHPLGTAPVLHRAERAALLQEEDPLGDAQDSRRLRARLARLPGVRTAHTLPPVLALGPPATSLPRPRTAHHPRICRILGPDLFTPVPGSALRAAELGDALSLQLLQLLEAGTVAPGDVLLDVTGIVTRLRDRSAAIQWGQLVLQHVAQRHHLLRYRPRSPSDPGSVRRGHVWAVSEAALTMAPLARRSLAPG